MKRWTPDERDRGGGGGASEGWKLSFHIRILTITKARNSQFSEAITTTSKRKPDDLSAFLF